jgi:hypothetical protein
MQDEIIALKHEIIHVREEKARLHHQLVAERLAAGGVAGGRARDVEVSLEGCRA